MKIYDSHYSIAYTTKDIKVIKKFIQEKLYPTVNKQYEFFNFSCEPWYYVGCKGQYFKTISKRALNSYKGTCPPSNLVNNINITSAEYQDKRKCIMIFDNRNSLKSKYIKYKYIIIRPKQFTRFYR